MKGGFIAQDVEKIFPQFISEIRTHGKDSEIVDKAKSLALKTEMTAYIVEAIKELDAKNRSLKEDVLALRKEVDALRSR